MIPSLFDVVLDRDHVVMCLALCLNEVLKMKRFLLHANLIIACPSSFLEPREYLPAQGSLHLLLKPPAIMISSCLYSSSIFSRSSYVASLLDPPPCLVNIESVFIVFKGHFTTVGNYYHKYLFN